MKRRHILEALGASVVSAAAAAGAEPQACAVRSGPVNYSAIPAVCDGDLEHYFTEEKLRSLVELATPLPKRRYEVVCYNYPCWHPCPWLEARFGKGWTQFQALRDSKPMYPGHLFPKYPLWGEYNEADPKWAAKEIDTAAAFGIDVWMHCWYWQEGVQRCHLQLQDGFLKAPNRDKLKFGIMWANHDYFNGWLSPTALGGKPALLSRQNHSEEDTMRALDSCIERYFRQPNYWRIDGAVVLGLYSVDNLLRDIPLPRLRTLFDRMRERVVKAGLGGLHLQASAFNPASAQYFKELGIQSATLYGAFGSTLSKLPPGGRAPYGRGAAEAVGNWRRLKEKCPVPFFPTCQVGWDDSPRHGNNSRILTQRSPDQYERFLTAAKYFLEEKGAPQRKTVFLSAWNEWTEDHVLLPDTVYGYSYLETVRRVFRG